MTWWTVLAIAFWMALGALVALACVGIPRWREDDGSEKEEDDEHE